MDINDLTRRDIEHFPGRQWKRSVNGMRIYMIKLCMVTNGNPFIYSQLPDELKVLSYHRKAISRGYIKEVDKVGMGNRRISKWVIA